MLPAASVVWYVTGRFYALASSGALFDAGYFLHLPFIGGDVFPHFTFHAEPFQSKSFDNGELKISIDPVGEFRVFHNPQPCGDFDRPETFRSGKCIATFRRASIVVGTEIAGFAITNVFSAELIASEPFEHHGVRYDFRDFVPNGVTQWGTAGTMPITGAPEEYSLVLPFTGSAVAVG